MGPCYLWTLNRSTFWSQHRITIWTQFEGPHSARGSTQVHEGPYRDYGHVLHNAKYGHGPIRVLKGPKGTTHSMVPLRDQDLDPDYGIFWTFYKDYFNVVPE